jgi:hypothetical protein
MQDGKDSKDWVAIAVLVPGRTRNQCKGRWHNFLKHGIDRTPGHACKWTEDESAKLKDAVHRHGGKDWIAIAALIPGRTKLQCTNKWHDTLKRSIKLTPERTDVWTTGEDSKLKDIVHTDGDTDSIAITALIPGRTKIQCSNRWHDTLQHSPISKTSDRTLTWSTCEDSKLKDAVHMHSDAVHMHSDWAAIAALLPRRSEVQCWCRWHDFLKHSIDQIR